MVIRPEDNKPKAVIKGPNIKPFPLNTPLGDNMDKKVVLKVGDNITTDHIMPSGAKLLPYRSNIPYLSEFCFSGIDGNFSKNCKENNGGFIVAGENYGQGSSREHAALVPLYLGIKVVFAKSFARIHKANLINTGILPLVFENPDDHSHINRLDEIEFKNLVKQLKQGDRINATNKTTGRNIKLLLEATDREKNILLCGGYINYIKGGSELCHV